MKVLQLAKYFPPFYGGIETITYDLYKYANESIDDIDMDVIYCNKSIENDSVFSSSGGSLFSSDILFTILSTPFSKEYLEYWIKVRNYYDVVHVHFPNPMAAFCLFFFPTKAKVIIHWHSDIFKQKVAKKFYNFIQNSVLESSDIIVATSQKYLDSSLDLKRFYSKCRVIPIGVKRLPCLSNDIIHKYRMENGFNGKKIIFSLGRLTYYKGFDFLIESARYLPDDYLILIGGEGELKQSLIDKIESVGVSNKVKLLGRLTDDELNVYFNISDIFCLPSVHRSEAFGLVQAESMSLGKPVVSTDIAGSGVSWVNKHRYSGIVVPPQNSQLLARGFLDIFDNYNMFSCEAKKRYESHFTVDKMLSSFETLYFELKNNE